MASAQPLQKIDVHKTTARYEQAFASFEHDQTICAENRRHILDFLNACQLGKTVFGREKKRINERRLLKYLYTLRRINEWLGNKDFKAITQTEMEHFIARVDRNALDKTVQGITGPMSYADWTRRDIKVCIKKFYKWLLGDGRQFPDIVAWIDTYIRDRAPPCLTLEEVRRCVDHATTVKGKALLWTLFESGTRAEELLNVRLAHIKDKGTHFLIWIEFPKTYKRNLPVFEGYQHLKGWLEHHPNRDDPHAQLFPMTYAGVAKFLKRLGDRALDKKM